ncbi:MAG: hypothetical protein JWQ74_552 [Marmoricola sp.]|nr:hypothetical protein [Marmoricola sp.]
MVAVPESLRWRPVAGLLGYLLAVAVIAAPVAAEQAVENVRFADRLGTVPVEVSLCHNGYSTLDTGVLGAVYWKQTGILGFGACVRVTAPPEAAGTLSSYVDEKFVRTNAVLINDPDEIATAYGHAFASAFRKEFLRTEALLVALGLLVVAAIRRGAAGRDDDRTPWWGRRLARRLSPSPVLRVVVWPVLLVLLGALVSSVYAGRSFRQWSGSTAVGETYALPGVAELSFGSPQTREIAAQVRPFIEKNTERLRERGDEYADQAVRSFDTALAGSADRLKARAGERIVLAEADPQGSFVGTAVRTRLYPLLLAQLDGAVVLRTISGDITSNGTVAEDGYVKREAASLKGVPTVATAGDHDSARTLEQMEKYGMVVPNLDPSDVAGIRVTTANDPEFKTLFGGSVTNPSGVSEAQLGQRLRSVVDPDEPGIVVLHQPEAAAAYLGVPKLESLALGHSTTPYDDGIPDVPPGIVDVGHSHRSIGPFVIWNTDTATTTWTVVDRLGTSGGAESSPTFNRFSTPFSVPLRPIQMRLQYVDRATGLQTGYATITVGLDGNASVSERTDVGLPLPR